MRHRPAAIAAGLLLDRLAGEPPPDVHPVAGFGALMHQVERITYADARGAGVGYTLAGVAIGATAGAVVPLPVAVGVCAAGRALRRTATVVQDTLDAGDLDEARALLPALVGRDPSSLDASGIASAVVESVAENTVDAVVAPALWALAAGGRGACVHRAVNTMDAMVGHRSERYERFGWCSARADDVANFVPARVTALLVAGLRPSRAAAVGRAVREQAPAHPSPNAGVAEAAFAAALGVQLGGALRYGSRVEHRPLLGEGPRPGPSDITRAVRLADRVELAFVAFLVLAAFAPRRGGGRR
jgi:adenosylcobinamide-phosphate synthase